MKRTHKKSNDDTMTIIRLSDGHQELLELVHVADHDALNHFCRSGATASEIADISRRLLGQERPLGNLVRDLKNLTARGFVVRSEERYQLTALGTKAVQRWYGTELPSPQWAPRRILLRVASYLPWGKQTDDYPACLNLALGFVDQLRRQLIREIANFPNPERYRYLETSGLSSEGLGPGNLEFIFDNFCLAQRVACLRFLDDVVQFLEADSSPSPYVSQDDVRDVLLMKRDFPQRTYDRPADVDHPKSSTPASAPVPPDPAGTP
jgi:hypothetical protein